MNASAIVALALAPAVLLIAFVGLPRLRARLVARGRWRTPAWDLAGSAFVVVAVPVGGTLAQFLRDREVAGGTAVGPAIGLAAGLCAARVSLVLSAGRDRP